MKRRHLWMVAISLIVAVCMSFCLAACDSCNKDDNKSHKHNYTWTPNEDGTTHNGVCNAEGECDAKNVTNEAHSYGSDDKCKCGAVKPGDGPVEHKHNYVWTDNKDGTHSGVCNSTVGECDAKNITNQPHVYGGDNKCACGAVKPDDNPGHTHNYGDWTVDPDDATKHVRTCDVDGCDKPVEREAHVWGDNDKCEKCGVDKPDEPNPDHTHNYGDWTVDPDDATKHVRTCDVDGCD
ncbi:MAG: hypothetical protein K2N23_05050, partial [Clostridia bacterium]|nr:hypothetical protein [Clostridia bacterium]